MDLIELTDSQLPGILALYNSGVERVPFGLPIGPDELGAWLEARSPRLEYERTCCLVDDGAVRGIARWGVGGPLAKPEDWYTVEPGDGVMSAMFVEPGDLASAQRLVDAAMTDLKGRGIKRVWAWEDEAGPPFYAAGFGQLSLDMTETVHALASGGFRPHVLELHLKLEPLEFRQASPSSKAFSVKSRKLDTGETSLDAYDASGAQMGQCVWAPVSLKSQHPEARHGGYVWWLGIEEAYRGHGAGRRLMELALGRMARNGHRYCGLTTRADNLRAQALYYSLGFRLEGASATLCCTT